MENQNNPDIEKPKIDLPEYTKKLEEKAKDRFVNQRVEINDLFIRRIQLITAVNERIYEETEPLNQLDETNSSMIPGMDEIIGAMGRARILIQAKLKLILKELLEFFGIEPGRVNFMWASAAEGERFAVLVRKATEIVKKLGPNTKFERKW